MMNARCFRTPAVAVCLLVLFSLIAAPSAGAQDLRLGLHAGGNFASLRGDTGSLTDVEDTAPESTVDLGRRTAFRAGGFLEIGLSEQFALRPELNYTQKGTSLDATLRTTDPRTGDVITVAEVDQTARFSYLELPVLAKFRIPTGGRLVPSLVAGPHVGINLTSEAETTIESQVDGFEDETETEDVNTTDAEVGVTVGGALAYQLASGNVISLNVRYGTGLTDVSPDEEDLSVQNEVVSVGLGFSFSL
jgi:hypothetical protein